MDSLGVYFPAWPLIVWAFPNLFSWFWKPTSWAPKGWLLGLRFRSFVQTFITEIDNRIKTVVVCNCLRHLFTLVYQYFLTWHIRRGVFFHIFTNHPLVYRFLSLPRYHFSARKWNYCRKYITLFACASGDHHFSFNKKKNNISSVSQALQTSISSVSTSSVLNHIMF